MASALPSGMDEDRVAAMSAALLSLGERAAENFGRGSLNQVYVEGENGTVFLVSADDEAVLVAVGSKGAKVGLLMFEVRRSAVSVADALRADDAAAAAHEQAWPEPVVEEAVEHVAQPVAEPVGVYEPQAVVLEAVPTPMAVVEELVRPEPEPMPAAPTLHVVEGALAEPSEADPTPDEDYPTPYEPAEPYATPQAEELPAPAPSAWGTPLSAVSQPDAPRRDPRHWTSYDQTDRDGGWA
jgi:predicted regulator of Ras-like GTPase activity (Roadblock/LC7/MglB family)